MFRLQREKPYVVVGDVRSVHLPGLLRGAPQPRRAPHVRALHAARHQLDMEAAPEHAAWRECQRYPVLPHTRAVDRGRATEVQLPRSTDVP